MATLEIPVDFILPFIESTRSTFSMMLGRELVQKEAYVKRNYVMFGDITGAIGLSGRYSGVCAVSLPGPLAISCVETLLGEKPAGGLGDSVVQDGVGELINMIAGGAKTKLSGTDMAIDFTLPTIIAGRGHELYMRQSTTNLSIIFTTQNDEEFALDVCTEVK